MSDCTACLAAKVMRRVEYHVGHHVVIHDLPKADRDDLRQEVLLALWLRWRAYDPDRGLPATYADRVAQSRLRGLARAHRRDARKMESVQAAAWDSVPGFADPPDPAALQSQADLRRDVRAVVENLPPAARDLCRLLLGHSIADVARQTGVPRSTLHGRVRALRPAFAAAGLAELAKPLFSVCRRNAANANECHRRLP